METNAGEVRKTLELAQQGNEDAEIFVGNNTKERNGEERIKTMLEEYLQKLDNLALERLSSQATKLLTSEPRQAELRESNQRQLK